MQFTTLVWIFTRRQSRTVSSGLTVNLTYNGSTTAPTNAGSYTVIGTISDANYQGWVALEYEAKEDPWARYDRMKLPPARVAELRAESQRRIDKARADGVYEKLVEWKAKKIAGMAEPVQQTEPEDPWARYERMKLTPEQVAEKLVNW